MTSIISREEIDRMIRIARDPNASESDLSPLFDRSGKVDLVLAMHRNSSPDKLAKLASKGTDAVRRCLVKNPSFPLGAEYIELVNLFPEEFLKIKDVESFPKYRPDRLAGLTSILELDNCPLEIINFLARHGSFEQKEIIYKSGRDLDGSMTGMSGKLLAQRSYESALMCLDSIQEEGFDEGKRAKLRKFLESHRAFAIPKYHPQDRSSESHRRGSLLGGFPFTSKKHPWPLTDGGGLPMQPVIQIDLVDAAPILGLSLGTGLLQIWGRVDSNRDQAMDQTKDWYNSQVLMRLIPTEDLGDDLDYDCPYVTYCETSEFELEADAPQPIFPDVPDEMKVGSVIRWIGVGCMWQHPLKLDFESDTDDYDLTESVFNELDSFITLPTNAPKLYLGGYGGQSGGWDDPTINDDNTPMFFRGSFGSGMNFGVMVDFSKKDSPRFKWVLKYYQ